MKIIKNGYIIWTINFKFISLYSGNHLNKEKPIIIKMNDYLIIGEKYNGIVI